MGLLNASNKDKDEHTHKGAPTVPKATGSGRKSPVDGKEFELKGDFCGNTWYEEK